MMQQADDLDEDLNAGLDDEEALNDPLKDPGAGLEDEDDADDLDKDL